MVGDPRVVLVDVGGVHREHVAVGGEPVHGEVVDDRAVRIAEDRVLDLADLQRRDVVGGDGLERGQRGGPVALELAHVAHVEEADGAAHRPMLVEDAGVLDRHVPATEGHHARARGDVRGMERRALEWRLAHALGSQSRSGFT